MVSTRTFTKPGQAEERPGSPFQGGNTGSNPVGGAECSPSSAALFSCTVTSPRWLRARRGRNGLRRNVRNGLRRNGLRRNTERFVAQRLDQLALAITLEITLSQAVPLTDRL